VLGALDACIHRRSRDESTERRSFRASFPSLIWIRPAPAALETLPSPSQPCACDNPSGLTHVKKPPDPDPEETEMMKLHRTAESKLVTMLKSGRREDHNEVAASNADLEAIVAAVLASA
jgi:hypothetical protein